jgi:TP901 family phage tail tape measure protein
MGRDANGALQSIKIRPLALDMDNLATRTMVAAQKQQLFNQLLTQGSTNLLNFGKNTQWAGRQLMVGFTIPLTLFATSAAKSFMEIEKQVIKIRRVYGDFSTTVKETDDMVTSIKALAGEYTKYGIEVEKTIGLASEAAAAGKTGQELLAQVSQATRLAVLGNVEQTQALETTMSITNAFGTATEKLASKIDFLNAVENQSVTSIEDLTEAIPKAGPVVQQLGGDVEDLAFFLTAMKEGGINASEGANALKSGLAALINPTGKAKEMLQGFGINIEKIVESNKGDIKGLVIDFASALDTLDPLNRARAIEQLFGKFQFSRLSTLFQNVIGEGTQASRVLELTKATTQELAILSQRELKKVEDTTTYKFEKAFADFQAALAPVGESFLKVVTPILEFGTKLLTQFNSMGDGAKNFTVILTTVVAGIGPVLLMTVGLVANGVANLIKMFQLLGGIFKKTGVDTGILGTQTDYMTQQQIEAAAVAASLNQSHSKLTQTFSVEAAALNSLTAAYQKAITAQRGFGGGASVPGSSTKPKKYAKGGMVRGPGSGTSDSILAMLSNGEAVIPAKQTEKYKPIVEAIISGNLNGYANGGVVEKGAKRAAFGASMAIPGIGAVGLLAGLGFGIAGFAKSYKEVEAYLTPDEKKQLDDLIFKRDPTIGRSENRARRHEIMQRAQKRFDADKKSKQKNIGIIPGYANGIVSVPGPKGRGDIVPAMLSPGEAVIPAAMAKKYGGLINGMIAGSIPGYEEGLGIGIQMPNTAYTSQIAKDSISQILNAISSGAVKIEQAEKVVAQTMLDLGNETKISMKSFIQRLAVNSEEIAGQSVANQINKFYQGDMGRKGRIVRYSASGVGSIEKQMADSGRSDELIRAKKRLEAEASLGLPGQIQIDRAHRVAVGSSGKLFPQQAFTAEAFNPQTHSENAISNSLAGDNRDLGFMESYSKNLKSLLDENIIDQKEYNSILEKAKNNLALSETELATQAKVLKRVVATEQDMLIKNQALSNNIQRVIAGSQVSGGLAIGTSAGQITSEARKIVLEDLQAAKAGVIKGVRDSTKQASPSKEAYNSGANIGKGAINGLNSKVDDAAKAGENIGQAAVRGTQVAGDRRNRRVTKATDGQIVVSQPGTQIIPGATRGSRRSQKFFATTNGGKNISFSSSAARDAYVAKQERVRAEATQRVQNANSIGSRVKGAGGKIAGGIRGGMMRMGGMGTMGAGMAASMGGMALSSIPGMESVGGAVSGVGGIISVLGMLGPMLASIPIPILAIGAAAGGLIAAGVIAEQKMKEVRKAASDMAIAMGSGQSVMQGFAESAGSVSPSQLMSMQRQESLVPLKVITDETIAFGQAYLESEAGKALIDGFKKTALESSNSAAIKSLGNQLSTAVITGILSNEQADSIALAIQTSLSNQSIVLDVVAKIEGTFASGDLTSDTGLSAGAGLIEDSAQSASDTLTSLFAKTKKVTGIFDSSWGSIAESEGKFAGELVSMLGQEQLMVDALDIQYQKRIENLKLQGKEQEAIQLTAEWETKRGDLIDENAKRNQKLLDVITEMTAGNITGRGNQQYSADSARAIKNQVVQSAKDVFVGTDQESTANTLLDKISSGKMDTTASVMISASIAAGSMSLDTLDKFVNTFNPAEAGNTETYNFAANILTNYGAEGSTIIDIANMFEDEEKATTFIAEFNAMNLEDGQEAVSILSDLTKFSGIVNIEALASFVTSGSDKAQDFIDSMGELETLSASGNLNYESIIEQNIITDPAAEAAFAANQEYFNNLPDVQKKLYVQAFLSVVATVSDEDVAQFRKEAGAFGSYFAGSEGKNKAIAAIAAQRAKAIVQAQNAFNSMMGSAEDGGGGDGAGGGGGGGTPEDAEIKRLNDLKDKQQKALNVIALKEDAINKVYDKRKKALEDIAKLNQKIAENQKSQLTIAEALSSGDISAAARAVQDARAKAAQYAEDQQMQALEKKRQMELDGIIVNGKTKEAYEAEIAKLNLQIAERELAIANGAATSGGGSGGGSAASSGRSGTPLLPGPPAPATNLKPTGDAGYGKTWVLVGNTWTQKDKAKPGTLKPGYTWLWNTGNDTWSQTPVGGSSGLTNLTRSLMASGGMVANKYMASGGMTKYFAGGGSLGSDTIPAMLTPGEFVVKRPAVQSFGVKNLEAINSGKSTNGSVYNYSVTVNASTGANADEIARTVISRIKQVDGQKLRGNRY